MSKQLSCYAKKLYHSWKKEGKSWNWLDIYVLRFETLVHIKYGTFEQVLSVGVKFWNLKRLRCTNYDACIQFWQFPNFAPYKYKQAWIILNFYTDTKIVPHQKSCWLVHMIFIFIKMILEVLYKWPVYTSSALKSQINNYACTYILWTWAYSLKSLHALQLCSVDFYRGGSIVVVSSFAGYKPSEVSNFS